MDYTRFTTLNIARRGRDGAVLDVQMRGREIAARLAEGSQTAIGWTKYALNYWLRQAGPSFDAALAPECMGFAGADVRAGLASLRERRASECAAARIAQRSRRVVNHRSSGGDGRCTAPLAVSFVPSPALGNP